MLNKRCGILAGILVVVAALLISARLVVADEGPPPVQPAAVESQADTLWNQFDSVRAGDPTVASFVQGSESGLAADDFYVTETVHTAWIISQVVVRASVSGNLTGSVARIRFYRASNGPVEPPVADFPGLSASNNTTDTEGIGAYRVITFSLPSSVGLWTTTPKYWVSVQMSGLGLGWYWRPRSDSVGNPILGSDPFAYKATTNWYPGNYTSSCRGQWQVQRTGDNCGVSNWPAGKDLSFKLLGSYFDGTLLPMAYLPLAQR